MTDYRLAWLNFLYWQNRHTLKKKKKRSGGGEEGVVILLTLFDYT